MLDGFTIVYRSNVDLYFYVMGSSHENEVSKKVIRLLLFISHVSERHMEIKPSNEQSTSTIYLTKLCKN